MCHFITRKLIITLIIGYRKYTSKIEFDPGARSHGNYYVNSYNMSEVSSSLRVKNLHQQKNFHQHSKKKNLIQSKSSVKNINHSCIHSHYKNTHYLNSKLPGCVFQL